MVPLRCHKIASIPGDGIGIDVVRETLKVLKALEDVHQMFTLDIETFDWSSEAYLKNGVYIPDSAWPRLKACDAILFGAVGSPGEPHQCTAFLVSDGADVCDIKMSPTMYPFGISFFHYVRS